MAGNSLTSYHHTERNELVISLYKEELGIYMGGIYDPWYLRHVERYEEDEDTIGPKVIVEWNK